MEEQLRKIQELERRLARLEVLETPLKDFGTAFPLTSLYAGRQFFRTDQGILWYYDGSNWQPISPLVPVAPVSRFYNDAAAKAAGFTTNIQITGVATVAGSPGTIQIPAGARAVWWSISIGAAVNGNVRAYIDDPSRPSAATNIAGYIANGAGGDRLTASGTTMLSSTGQLRFTTFGTSIAITNVAIDIYAYLM